VFKNYTLKEILGILYYSLLVNGWPHIIGSIYFKLQSFFWGLECGKNIKSWGIVDVIRAPKTQIKIGNNILFNSSSIRTTASSLYGRVKLRTFERGAKIIIGDNVGLNGTSITARSKAITIGDGTIIAPNVIIVDSDFHAQWPPDNRLVNPGFESDEDVIIGENVWIGMNSIILKGAKIGDNSIIGAGSIVTDVIPPNCVAIGNPAKLIKQLPG
jgi:acetyltransferase-like isoleucine patch superfamily enzyme